MGVQDIDGRRRGRTVYHEIGGLLLLITVALVSGCATHIEGPDWRQKYRNCTESGQAYFSGIPIASRTQHEEAERFAPTNAANCSIYVFANWSHGSKSAHASIFLYRRGTEPPTLLPDYWPLFGTNTLMHPRWSDRWLLETSSEFPEFGKAEIYSREVYAMWELAPGDYVLDASTFIAAPFKRTSVTCIAGHTTYLGLTKHFWLEKLELNVLDVLQGRELVRFRLRSAGKQPGGYLSPGWIGESVCPKETK
jgi:hypothetical protein